MGERTAIEWTDHTFNPWEGCQKVGPGCDHCYAETRNARYGDGTAPNWGPGAPRRRTSESNWRQPLAWDRRAAREGRRCRVFCASLADVFDNAVDPAWRADLFALIRATPNLDWLLLTKRIGNASRMIADAVGALPRDERCGTGQHNHTPLAQWPWPNVWLGATVVNQEEADRDIPKLLAVPARVRFLSIEPLLGPIGLERACDIAEQLIFAGKTWGEMAEPSRCIDAMRNGSVVLLDWVIVGGESGRDARPIHPDWARSLRDQCAEAGVPFLFKQWGEWANRSAASLDENACYERSSSGGWVEPDGTYTQGDTAAPVHLDAAHAFRIGKKLAGRLLDGVQHDDYPVAP